MFYICDVAGDYILTLNGDWRAVGDAIVDRVGLKRFRRVGEAREFVEFARERGGFCKVATLGGRKRRRRDARERQLGQADAL